MSSQIRKAVGPGLESAIVLMAEYYKEVGVIVHDARADLEHYDIWLAWSGDEPAGCILLRDLPSVPRAGEIKRMYVRPRYRRLGLGEALLHSLEDHAIQSGLQWLYLDTRDDLRAAISCYRRNGFVDCARYNENQEATIFMRKLLRQPELPK